MLIGRSAKTWRALALAAAFAIAALFAAPASAQTQVAVEYYYADWNFYFVTSDPAEIAALDGGAFGGLWKRTGQTFTVWSGPTNGALPACRFFSVVFAPKSSHFYTPYADECASLKAGAAWQYEGIAFYVLLPDANGNCPAGTVVLYRLYNNGMGGAPNHRFTTSVATFNAMLAQGWIFEGDGRTGAYACVPAPSGPPATAEGLWVGSTSTGALVLGVVLDDSGFYFLYSAANDAGILSGTASQGNGQFLSSDAVNINLAGRGVVPATVTGSFVPQTSLAGTVSSSIGSSAFNLLYGPVYQQPANLAAAAGAYAGIAGTVAGNDTNVKATINADGSFAGSATGCALSGTLTPHGNVNVFDVAMTYQGGACVLGSGTVAGVAYYDVPSAQLFVIAVNAGRTDGLLLLVTKQ